MKRANLGMMRRNAVIIAGNILKNETNNPLLAMLRTIAERYHEVKSPLNHRTPHATVVS